MIQKTFSERWNINMTSDEIKIYIDARNKELSADEIIKMVDVSQNPQINSMRYQNGVYEMWDQDGQYFMFRKRTWH